MNHMELSSQMSCFQMEWVVWSGSTPKVKRVTNGLTLVAMTKGFVKYLNIFDPW